MFLYRKYPNKGKQSGPSSSVVHETHEVFGGVDGILESRKLEASDNHGGNSLQDQFDPSVLSEKYMTGKDGRIREIDAPERMQV